MLLHALCIVVNPLYIYHIDEISVWDEVSHSSVKKYVEIMFKWETAGSAWIFSKVLSLIYRSFHLPKKYMISQTINGSYVSKMMAIIICNWFRGCGISESLSILSDIPKPGIPGILWVFCPECTVTIHI